MVKTYNDEREQGGRQKKKIKWRERELVKGKKAQKGRKKGGGKKR